MSKKKRRNRKKTSFMDKVLNWVVTISVAVVLAFLVRTYGFVPAVISGNSMADTYAAGDVVLVTKFDYLNAAPQRGDVALCSVDGRDGVYVKRVIGVPGDTVVLSNGTVTVNGTAISEPYVAYPSDEEFTVTLGEDEFMVLGDNRQESYDSREADMGMLSAKDFAGKVRFRIWPLIK